MSMSIHEIPAAEAPLDLLLLADPSEEKLRSYLGSSRCFVVVCDGITVGACAVQPRVDGIVELMSIAVSEDFQKAGIGARLLRWVIDVYRNLGEKAIEVGTGAFGYQLAFYQRHGFRVTRIDHDFFINNYPAPIVENGIQHFDMLRLTLPLQEASSAAPPRRPA